MKEIIARILQIGGAILLFISQNISNIESKGPRLEYIWPVATILFMSQNISNIEGKGVG